MPEQLRIDFVSDIACPWCAIGLWSLEKALEGFPGLQADFRLHPFELSPGMRPEGENLWDHIAEKYTISRPEAREGMEQILKRGAELGFVFTVHDDNRVYNTFDCHRLLHWAQEQGKGLALKKALFTAYFTENRNPGDHAVLSGLAGRVGLDAEEARAILESDRYKNEVNAELEHWRNKGVRAVPTVILRERVVITCAQTVAGFAQYIRSALSEDARSGRPLM